MVATSAKKSCEGRFKPKGPRGNEQKNKNLSSSLAGGMICRAILQSLRKLKKVQEK
jgi:hypothetical protein